MFRISLIVATLGERPGELTALLSSLVPQADFIQEVIVVDQNTDPERVPAVLVPFQNVLPLCHICSPRGLSRARNAALPLVTGRVVAFPDDDCLYPEGLLKWVANWFQSNIEYDILSVGVNDANGVSSGNRWLQNACDIRPLNAFRTTFSSSLFILADIAASTRFDVKLGVGAGTRFGSGEETDYVLRLLTTGARGRFDRSRHIVHPRRDMLSGHASLPRAEAYGFGMGHLLRRHSLRKLWGALIVYNLARATWAQFCRDSGGANCCLAQTRGLWNGFRNSRGDSVDTAKGRIPMLTTASTDDHAPTWTESVEASLPIIASSAEPSNRE